MDSSEQQKQTKEFFENSAGEWSRAAKNESDDTVNVIKIRNQYVESECLKHISQDANILDVGCGTGELYLEL